MRLLGRRRTTLFVCAALSSTLCLRPGFAQEEADEAEPKGETPRFESAVKVEAAAPAGPQSSTAATRLPVSVQELPVNVAVVPNELLGERTNLVLGDALTNVSGVNVATGFGVFDYFVIRGFDSLDAGLVLTDGIPELPSSFYPMYNVRQVEVVKGPASFLHGGSPLSGAVQLTRKQPEGRRFADVRLGYGRFGTYEAALDANAASADGRLGFRLNAVYQGSEGYRDLPSGSIAAVNPVLSWRPDDKTLLALDLEYARSEWPPDTGIPFAGWTSPALAPVPRTQSYQSSLDASTQDVYRFRLHAERRLNERLTLRNRLYFTELSWDSVGTLISGVYPGEDARLQVARSITFLDDRRRLLGNQLELQASFDTGSVGHELLVGLELSQLKDRFTQDVGLLPPLDLLAPVEPIEPPPVLPLPPLGLAGDSRSLVVAPYLVDRVRLSEKVKLFVGARLGVLDYEDPPNQTERDATRVDPLLGLTVNPVPDLSLYANWATGSAPPSTQVLGPRDLEYSEQVELGAKLTFLGGKGFASLSGYELRRENIGIPDSTGITRQDGDERSRGVEVDLAFDTGSGWQTHANYAFTDAILTSFSELVPLQPPDFVVLDRSGNRAPFAPRHIFGLWTSKRLPFGLRVGGGVRHVSQQFVAADNLAAIGSYTTLDAVVAYDQPRWGLRVHFENLTSTEYETRGFGAYSAIPGRPFGVHARLRVGFGEH